MMSRILKFSEYVFENESIGSYESFLMLPSNLQKLFKKNVSRNLLPKILGKNRFYIDLQGEDIYFKLDGRSVLFPFLKIVDNKIKIDNDYIGIREEYNRFNNELFPGSPGVSSYIIDTIIRKSRGEQIRDISPYYDGLSLLEIIGKFISLVFDSISYYFENNPIDDGERELNPFTDLDLDNNPAMKILGQMNVRLVSTPMQKKNGNIALECPHIDANQVIIYSNGYIRRKDINGRIAPMTTNMELTRPIKSEDDLTLKLTYMISYVLKTILKSYGVSSKEINKIGKSIASGDFDEYDTLILKLASENPAISHILPDYNNVIPDSLKKGSKLMARFGGNFFG
jgi:hypothetical protein